jgi:hypothetical protein
MKRTGLELNASERRKWMQSPFLVIGFVSSTPNRFYHSTRKYVGLANIPVWHTNFQEPCLCNLHSITLQRKCKIMQRLRETIAHSGFLVQLDYFRFTPFFVYPLALLLFPYCCINKPPSLDIFLSQLISREVLVISTCTSSFLSISWPP